MYTVDASVWVNGFDQREDGHEDSRRFLEHIYTQGIPIVVPNLVCIEVAAAISRTRKDPQQAEKFARALSRLPELTLVPLDGVLMNQAMELAAQQGLRGADALYATVASEEGCTLVSRDREHLTRLTGPVTTMTPTQALGT